jgi:hypothetical protein
MEDILVPKHSAHITPEDAVESTQEPKKKAWTAPVLECLLVESISGGGVNLVEASSGIATLAS